MEATEAVGVAHARVVAFPLLMERLGELPGGCCEGDLCSPRHRCFLEILGGVNASTEHGADSQRLAPRASSSLLPGPPGEEPSTVNTGKFYRAMYAVWSNIAGVRGCTMEYFNQLTSASTLDVLAVPYYSLFSVAKTLLFKN